MARKIVDPSDGKFADTPAGWAERWKAEFQAAKPQILKWQKKSEKVVKSFLGEKRIEDDRLRQENINLFYSNIATLQSLLFGQLPKVEVDRKFADANDQQARVAAQILDRILNQDIQRAGDDFGTILRSSLSDRLLPGLGTARVRYDYRSEMEEVPAEYDPQTGMETVPAGQQEVIKDEWVDTIYTHWKDFLWSPARTHAEIRWKAFRSYMTKEKLEDRFCGPDATIKINVDDIPMSSKGPMASENSGNKSSSKQVTPQAEVWEIWNGENRRVYWFVENFNTVLDMMDDPLELEQFFPDPPPMIANTTTSNYIPKSDYAIAQDLYLAVDVLESRISSLTESCKLVGVYDKSQDDIKRLLNEGIENQLIPVDNWAMFAEKGGLKGLIEWLPLESVIETIAQLQQQQDRKIQQLYELTGMSDVVRGASQQAYTSAAETKTKVQFSSVRVQSLQNDFTRWVSNLQSLKAEIICKHYQAASIMKQSNIGLTVDAQMAPQAIALLKNPDSKKWRIIVQPENLAMADYQQMKQDRTEFMMAISQFMQSSAPLVQMDPEFVPYLLQLLQWGMSGFKGSNQIEGVMDQAIQAYTAKSKANADKPPKPSPDEIKGQQIQAEGQLKMQLMQQESQSKMQHDQAMQQMELERAQAAHQADMEKLNMQTQLETLKFNNQMEIEKATLVANIAKIAVQQRADVQSQAIDMVKHTEQTSAKAAADTATMTHGAITDMAVREHDAKMTKQENENAAKVQVQSGDKGNGGSNK